MRKQQPRRQHPKLGRQHRARQQPRRQQPKLRKQQMRRQQPKLRKQQPPRPNLQLMQAPVVTWARGHLVPKANFLVIYPVVTWDSDT